MKFKMTEGIVIAAFPVFGFISALMFEMGYADAFGYSHELIDIDLKLTLVAMALIALVLAPLVIYCWAFWWSASRGGAGGRLVSFQMILPLPMLICWYMTGFQSANLAVGLGISVFIAMLPLIKLAYLCLRHDFSMALDIMVAAQRLRAKPEKKAGGSNVAWYEKAFAVLLLSVCVIALALMARGVGSLVAHNKSAFSMFVSDSKEYVILSAYADRFVVGGIANNAFDGNIYVFAKNSERLINIRVKRYDNFWRQFEW